MGTAEPIKIKLKTEDIKMFKKYSFRNTFWDMYSRKSTFEKSRWGLNFCCLDLAAFFSSSPCFFSALKTPGAPHVATQLMFSYKYKTQEHKHTNTKQRSTFIQIQNTNIFMFIQHRPMGERRSARRMTGVNCNHDHQQKHHLHHWHH